MELLTTKHPKALPYLCLTELWERFGFYIVQGLFVLYMTEYFGYSDTRAYTLLGIFTALAYISPLVGGYLANHLLSYKQAIIWGGLFLVVGYALIAYPFANLLYPGLATVIVGNGLFKPNISNLLGLQYTGNDERRDVGFTIFYIGINIGVFLAGMSSGYIKNYFGWKMSFALASVGLIGGLLTFYYGYKKIEHDHASKFIFTPVNTIKWLICCLLAITLVSFLLLVDTLASYLLPIVGCILVGYICFLIYKQEGQDKIRLTLLFILILSSIVFWALFLQLFYSANLYIDRLVDKNFLGLTLTTTVFYASESIFIICLGPLFALMWGKLANRQRNPHALSKFSFGISSLGVGFLVLAASTAFLGSDGLVDPLWIFTAYLLITIGELSLSPIGLSAVTFLAPKHLLGLMMGIWFVATGFGGILAGWLADFSSIPAGATVEDKLVIYQDAFLIYALWAFVVAALLWCLRRFIKALDF